MPSPYRYYTPSQRVFTDHRQHILLGLLAAAMIMLVPVLMRENGVTGIKVITYLYAN